MLETSRRSLLKSLSWRVCGTLITGAIAYCLTGRLAFAAKVGGAETLLAFAGYYMHERLWVRISYGRIKPPTDYQI